MVSKGWVKRSKSYGKRSFPSLSTAGDVSFVTLSRQIGHRSYDPEPGQR
jgi:hypothetical protein